jgi:hypothetical protein
MISLWTGQLVLRIPRARTRTSTTIQLFPFLSTSSLHLVIYLNQHLSKIFCRNREKKIKERKGDRLVQHRINERYMHNQCKPISSRSICFQGSPYLHQTRAPTHTHMHVHTKILVLQYFFIAYLQTARTERPFSLQNETAERKGGSYMFPLLYICSMCFHGVVV